MLREIRAKKNEFGLLRIRAEVEIFMEDEASELYPTGWWDSSHECGKSIPGIERRMPQDAELGKSGEEGQDGRGVGDPLSTGSLI